MVFDIGKILIEEIDRMTMSLIIPQALEEVTEDTGSSINSQTPKNFQLSA